MASETAAARTPLSPDELGNKVEIAISIAVVMTLVATLSVVLRFFARRRSASIGYDDWTVLAALVCSYAYCIVSVMGVTVGHGGFHIDQYSGPQLEKFMQVKLPSLSKNYLYWEPDILLKTVLAAEVCFRASITLSKASILLFYGRIFAVKSFLTWAWIVGGALFVYFVTAVLLHIFMYSPVDIQWKPGMTHTAVDIKTLWLVLGVLNVIFDVVILCMPQARVWRLQQTTRKKVLLSMVFLLGAL